MKEDDIDIINGITELKIKNARKTIDFENLENHRVVEILREDVDESADEAAAKRLVKDALSGKESKPSEKKDEDKKESKKSSKKSKSKNEAALDPVMTKGGFKFLSQYHNPEWFEGDDIMDKIEDGLYTDYIHKGSSKFKDIMDVAIISRADADVVTFKLSEKEKRDYDIDERICKLKESDLDFEWEKNKMKAKTRKIKS